MGFRDLPIRRKLQTAILASSVSVLLLTCVTIVTYEYFTVRAELTRSLSTLARITAMNSTGALAFKNQEDAAEVLSALVEEPHIVVAALYDENGAVFATYARPEMEKWIPSSSPAIGSRFSGGYFDLAQTVEREKPLGVLFVKSDLGAMYERFRLYLGIVLLVMSGSVLVALLLSDVLQRWISAPVVSLAETARSISREKDYSVRARKAGEDEIGLLTDAFNEMLTEIQESQAQLSQALSDARKSAGEVRQLNQELERRVAQRTAALQDAMGQMEAFSYSVSHDLRAPLRALHGYSQALLEDCSAQLGPTGLNYIQRIKKAAERLDRLIQDVLTYSRVSRGDMALGPVALDKLVHDIIEEYPAFQPPNARIRIESPLLDVTGDESSLTQCVSNLLSNAIKFVRSGVLPEVRIRTEAMGGKVRLWIEDNGIGIPKEHYERIFGMFERLNSDNVYEGTGIGLAIVKKAVERMNGRIGLQSEVDQGTRFWIELPRPRGENDASA